MPLDSTIALRGLTSDTGSHLNRRRYRKESDHGKSNLSLPGRAFLLLLLSVHADTSPMIATVPELEHTIFPR